MTEEDGPHTTPPALGWHERAWRAMTFRAGSSLWAVALSMAVACVLLAPALRSGFVWDDLWLIVRNTNIQRPELLGRALRSSFWDVPGHAPTASAWLYYRPFITLLYAGLWRLFREDAWGYHALNLLAHLGCVALAHRWLRDRVASRDDPAWRMALAAATMWFAVHSSRAESVVWISGCTDLWMTFWLLLASASWSRGRWGLAAVSAGLAALCKEVALALPALLALDLALGAVPPAASDEARAARRRGLGAILGAMVSVLLIRFIVVPPSSFAVAPENRGHTMPRVLSTLGGYVTRALWPWPDAVVFRPGRYEGGLWEAVGVLTLLALAVLCVAARRSRGARGALADAGWFVVPLVPVLNVFAISSIDLIGLRFLYLPVLGLGAIALRAASASRRASQVVAAVLWLMVAVHGVSLQRAVPAWRDDLTFWRRARALDREDVEVCRQLVVAVTNRSAEEGESLAAQCALDAGRAGAPRDALLLGLQALGARLRRQRGEDRGELTTLRDAYLAVEARRVTTVRVGGQQITLRPLERRESPWRQDPALLEGPLALLAFRLGLDDEAERRFRALLGAHPDDTSTRLNLAQLLGRQSRWQESLALFERGGRADEPGASRLVGLLRAGAAADSVRDAPRRAYEQASVLVELHAPARALDALRPFGDEPPPSVVILRARALVMEGRASEAVTMVQAAAARDPAHQTQWNEVLRRLQERGMHR